MPSEDLASSKTMTISRLPSCTSDPYDKSEIDADEDLRSDEVDMFPAVDAEQVCSRLCQRTQVVQHMLLTSLIWKCCRRQQPSEGLLSQTQTEWQCQSESDSNPLTRNVGTHTRVTCELPCPCVPWRNGFSVFDHSDGYPGGVAATKGVASIAARPNGCS